MGHTSRLCRYIEVRLHLCPFLVEQLYLHNPIVSIQEQTSIPWHWFGVARRMRRAAARRNLFQKMRMEPTTCNPQEAQALDSGSPQLLSPASELRRNFVLVIPHTEVGHQQRPIDSFPGPFHPADPLMRLDRPGLLGA